MQPAQPRKKRAVVAVNGAATKIPLAVGGGLTKAAICKGLGNKLVRGWLYATHQNAPDNAVYKARVNGRGLWRATLRPDIGHKPSEWGRVIVFLGRATNAPRLLTVAKLDGVNDYPNCRGGLSALDEVVRFASPVRIRR